MNWPMGLRVTCRCTVCGRRDQRCTIMEVRDQPIIFMCDDCQAQANKTLAIVNKTFKDP